MKSRITVSMDADLHRRATERFGNLSGAIEDLIRKRLGTAEVDISEPLKCEFCGTLGEKETATDVEVSNRKARENDSSYSSGFSNPHKLTWIYPDEKWICNVCLKSKAIHSP